MPDAVNGTDLYVVLLVVRTHHAVVYDMPTAAAPENPIAKRSTFRVSSGLGKVIVVIVICINN